MRHFIPLLLLLLSFNSACTPEQQNSDDERTLSSSGIDSLEAVQEEPQRKEDTPGTDTMSFEVAFEHFFRALQAGDTVGLNQFVSPERGLWLIEQPGAVPAYTHFQNIQAVQRSYQNQPFTSITEQMQECDLQERQEFPEFDCAWMDRGRSGFAEDGCFFRDATDFHTSDMWQYANLNPEQEEQVQRMQQQVQKTVLHTRTSYRFHFAHDGERWRLLFADLRVPCSA
ncbi:hypothetical protein DXT99_20540 [Pontibacter diazotrophicus]|uniref:Uncharacterized protein n=2 Tax=Pontibacter diazotrophicus TaxID=1400979 RepID=A0A3D8L7J7_9BACT|nr:hypothetical protein DXT99_20540 [Pontibacter diazotrophicus]